MANLYLCCPMNRPFNQSYNMLGTLFALFHQHPKGMRVQNENRLPTIEPIRHFIWHSVLYYSECLQRMCLWMKGGVSSQRQPRFERATRSLATFVRSNRSLRSLTPQRYACFARSLRSWARSLTSLTPSWDS